MTATCSNRCSRKVRSCASSWGRELSSSGALELRDTSSKLHSASPLPPSSPPAGRSNPASSPSAEALLVSVLLEGSGELVKLCWLMAPSANKRTELSSGSSNRSSNGLSVRICSSSWCNSSVDNCSSRIDCCSCGVSARCCDTRSCSVCFMGFYITCGNFRRDKHDVPTR